MRLAATWGKGGGRYSPACRSPHSSERLSRTHAQGDRLKEAQAINKSLSALGDVIQARMEKQKHVPFRNSTLTFLVRSSGGVGKFPVASLC